MSWYPSKVDLWLAVLIWVMPVAVVVAWIAALTSGSNDDLVAAVVASVLVVGILFGLVYPIRYGLDDKHLMVRFGLVRTRIPLADITTVKPTRNPLASPALSMDRLSIVSGPGLTGTVMISPADRERFLNELASRAGLKRVGNRLERG
ncbi:MAG: PH domain-containing protein [Rhodococcus sp.]|nr:PH domain-containing protein [Rhodococcus sp. (in: high G+C Gram-positive bacteria)]